MSIPKEPRQQMINIMYLVLIALLALNVSNEIVNAFKLLDDGIVASNNSIDQKIKGSFGQFQAAVDKNPEGKVYMDRARQLEAHSNAFIAKVDEMRNEIVTRSSNGEELSPDGWPKKLDDQDTPQKYMINEGNADRLAGLIKEYRGKFLGIFEGDPMKPGDKASFESALLLDVGEVPADSHVKDATWGTHTFNQMPLVSVITMLDKFKNDAKNSAAAGIDILKSKVSAEEILYDAFDVAIVPSATKLIQGETFKAEAFLTASASGSRPSISINGKGYPLDAKGRANYEVKANAVGKKSIKVNMSYKDGFGKSKTASKTFEYEVVPPPDHVPVVSADKMNAFYIGLDNPVSASITGIVESKTKVSMSGGTINKTGAGKYTVRVSNSGEVNINLSGTNELGENKSYSVPFRAKRIPDPVCMIGKSKGGMMKSGDFKAQQGLRAVLEDFLFDAKFDVKGYMVTLVEPGQDLQVKKNSGSRYNEASSLIQKAKPGCFYYFEKVKAVGPDGSTRTIPGITIKIG